MFIIRFAFVANKKKIKLKKYVFDFGTGVVIVVFLFINIFLLGSFISTISWFTNLISICIFNKKKNL